MCAYNNYGSRCRECSGEDCICCEVYLEYRADQRAQDERDPYDLYDEYEREYDREYSCPNCNCDDLVYDEDCGSHICVNCEWHLDVDKCERCGWVPNDDR